MTETDIHLPGAEGKDMEKLRSARTPTSDISACDRQDSRVYEQSLISYLHRQTLRETKNVYNKNFLKPGGIPTMQSKVSATPILFIYMKERFFFKKK